MKQVMYRLALLLLLLLMLVSLVACGAPDEEEAEEAPFEYDTTFVETPYAGTTLVVYNWGEYMSDGSEGSADIVALFEEKYGIKVIYATYASNEDMYAKLKSGGVSYDVIFPSEYMVGKLREEGLLEEIDTDSLSNYKYIDERYKGLFYDPQDRYSVPYTVGMLGILYNTTMVDPEDVEAQSWSLMWNEKYAGNILTFDNPRDAFGIAQLYQKLDLNSTEYADWDLAQEWLMKQRPLLQGYVMDEIFQTMEGGNAAIAAYYAGDCLSMMDENPDLAFYYPVEGTNIFIDAMCIPKGAKNVGAAHLFIDFLLEPDIAALNANYIAYASPNTAVLDNPYYDYVEGTFEYDILYGTPESYEDDPSKTQYYHTMPNDVIAYYNRLFDEVKTGNENQGLFMAILPVVMVGCVGFIVYNAVQDARKKRKKIRK